MTVAFIQGAPASTNSVAVPSLPTDTLPSASELPPVPQAQVRHLLFGAPHSVKHAIAHLHKLNYTHANDWSRLLPTGRPNEVMAILTKRVGSSEDD